MTELSETESDSLHYGSAPFGAGGLSLPLSNTLPASIRLAARLLITDAERTLPSGRIYEIRLGRKRLPPPGDPRNDVASRGFKGIAWYTNDGMQGLELIELKGLADGIEHPLDASMLLLARLRTLSG